MHEIAPIEGETRGVVIRGENKRQHFRHRDVQPRQIIETQFVPAAHPHDALDRFGPESGNAQEQFARRFVQIDREDVSVAQSP